MEVRLTGWLVSIKSKSFAESRATRVGSDTNCVKLKLRQVSMNFLASALLTIKSVELV